MASIPAYVSGFQIFDYHTETAGTVIDEQVPGSNGERLVLIGLEYTAAGTAHTMSILHCGGNSGQRVATTAAAVASQKDIIVDVAPKDGAGNAAAASDIIAYQVDDGSWEFNTVASLASLTITLTTNIAKPLLSGAKVRIFGVAGDNVAHKINLAASGTTSKYDAMIAMSPFAGDPAYVTVDNATHAGFLKNLIFAYINK